MKALVLAAAVTAATSFPAAAQKTSSCSAHHSDVDRRGDAVMGFDHEKTKHHFRLTKDGGVIEVTANSAEDTASRDAIRGHLSHIARMFSEGNFEAPMLIHAQMPPGVPVLKRKKDAIRWSYEEAPQGGRVVATTKDPESLRAIHEFLKFQIEDHRTGDSVEVEK
jgi:hypothetical protein